jgi:S-adenosylmethionine hydrolase
LVEHQLPKLRVAGSIPVVRFFQIKPKGLSVALLPVEEDAFSMPPATRPIVFASDFGHGNEWVGICHSVLAGLSPQSPIVDLTHLIRPLEVLSGALLLADSMPYFAEDAVVLGVVDPNVGKDREVAIETTSGRYLVGPDNGLLSLAWEAAGGIKAVVEISSPDVVHPPRAESFRAPDTLCPAAAHLALGRALDQLGQAVEPSTLSAVTVPAPEITDGEIRGEVLDFNRFGNIQLNIREPHLASAGLEDVRCLTIRATSASAEARRGRTFADFEAGEYGVIFDERGWMEIVRGNPESALEGLLLSPGHLVWISRSRAP